MDITKYGGYFHDGSLIDIQHIGNNIEFSMWSAEMHPEDMRDNIPLSSDQMLKGKLHVEGVKSITIDDKSFLRVLKMTYDSGEILHLKITNGKMELQIFWKNYPPQPRKEDFSTIEIEAEKIYWEPILDLVDPFW